MKNKESNVKKRLLRKRRKKEKVGTRTGRALGAGALTQPVNNTNTYSNVLLIYMNMFKAFHIYIFLLIRAYLSTY